jgi:hypothetical protein
MPFRLTASSHDAIRRLAIISLIGLVGCGPTEQVSKYTAPKDPVDFDLVSDEPAEGEAKVRILGAIAEAGKPGEESWYIFKFQAPQMGQTYPPKAIERHKADFEAFLKSVKFPAGGTPTWTVPAGWREVQVKTQIQRLATFRMKRSETQVDLAVSDAKGSLIENVNRWRAQQAGVEPITAAEIGAKCEVLTIDGRKVVVVDVSGPGGRGGMMSPHGK